MVLCADVSPFGRQLIPFDRFRHVVEFAFVDLPDGIRRPGIALLRAQVEPFQRLLRILPHVDEPDVSDRVHVSLVRRFLIPLQRFLEVAPDAGPVAVTVRDTDHAYHVALFRGCFVELERLEIVPEASQAIDLHLREPDRSLGVPHCCGPTVQFRSLLEPFLVRVGQVRGVLLDQVGQEGHRIGGALREAAFDAEPTHADMILPCLVVPFDRLLQILLHADPVLVTFAQPVHRPAVALFRGRPVPFQPLADVPFQPVSACHIALPDEFRGVLVAQFRGFLVPFHGFGVVPAQPRAALHVTLRDQGRGVDGFPGGLLEIIHGLAEVAVGARFVRVINTIHDLRAREVIQQDVFRRRLQLIRIQRLDLLLRVRVLREELADDLLVGLVALDQSLEFLFGSLIVAGRLTGCDHDGTPQPVDQHEEFFVDPGADVPIVVAAASGRDRDGHDGCHGG